MTERSPRISVLMPVYNAGKYLKESIESILGQTFTDFELLIINDGSTDATEQIVNKINDPRIRYVSNESNIGLVRTLNKGLSLITSEYIARMDADDIALPERFAKQVKFMDDHSHVGVCGTGYEIFGNTTGRPEVITEDAVIKARLLFGNLLLHPTVMIRNSVIRGSGANFGVPFTFADNYGHKVLELEDYALWIKLRDVTSFANIPEVLLRYRIEGQNITYNKLAQIRERKLQFFGYLLEELDIRPSEEIVELHFDLGSFQGMKSPSQLKLVHDHFTDIIKQNRNKKIYDQKVLEEVIADRWKRIFYYIAPLGFPFARMYWELSGFDRKQFIYFMKNRVKKAFNLSA